jgi:glucan phosphoethanolaminetransferase (alkaline phosphatase superfamily)
LGCVLNINNRAQIMQPKTHAEIINVCNIIIPIICIPVFIVLVIKATIEYDALPIFLFFVFIILLIYLLRFIPIRCSAPNCNSRMELTETYISTFTIKLNYHCKACGSSYEKTSFVLFPGELPNE